MLETEPPPGEAENKTSRSVSPPLNFHHVSRSSTPGVSYLNGTLRYLFSPSPPPPRPHSCPASLVMAIKQSHAQDDGRGVTQLQFKHEVVVGNIEVPNARSPQAQGVAALVGDSIAQPVLSLSRVACHLQSQRYQKQRRRQAESTLRQFQIAAARTARLVHAARSVQRTLAECIRSEDKQCFVNLFDAFHESSNRCLLLGSQATQDVLDDDERISYSSGFLDRLPQDSCQAVLDLLMKLRNDGEFVADRLACLTHKELLSLLPTQNCPKVEDSVFGSTPWAQSRASRMLGYVVDGQSELLSAGDFGSPLEALIYAVRGTCLPSSSEDRRELDVWSTVCARLIAEQKPGIEKFVPAVLDLWASASEWPGRQRLGLWMQQTLQSASFLLNQPNKQSFRMRVQGRQDASAEDEARTEASFNQAVTSLLALLGDKTGACVIPDGALRMTHAIWCKLQDFAGSQRAFPQFVLTRWLFSTFIYNAFTVPEAHGLMTDYYISDTARHRVLREIVSRAQKTVLDVIYSWRHGSIIPADTILLVETILGQVCTSGSRTYGSRSDQPSMPVTTAEHDVFFLTISAADLVAVLSGLCPQRKLNCSSSEQDTQGSGLRSSASSVSGFSLFRNTTPTGPSTGSAVFVPDTETPSACEPCRENDNPAKTSDPGIPLFETFLLEEACTNLEDLLSNPSRNEGDRWATLIGLNRQRPLQTVVDAVNQVYPQHNDNLLGSTGFVGISSCGLALEELLKADTETQNEDELYSSRFPLDYDCLLGHLVTQRFEQQIASAEERGDFVGAYTWFQDLGNLRQEVANGTSLGDTISAMDCVARDAIKRDEILTNSCETWSAKIRPALDLVKGRLSSAHGAVDLLRDKMWFVADVRISAAYDDARLIASALHVMGKPKRPSRVRMAPPLRHWSGSKLSSTSVHLKTEAQILELLSTSPDHGGPNKLSEDQARSTRLWMQSNNIENLCPGEERLHRFCMEIRKCIDRLLSGDSVVLSSNLLFAHDSLLAEHTSGKPTSGSLTDLAATAGRINQTSLQTSVNPSIDAVSSVSHPLSSTSSRDYLESRSPALTSKSSGPFWSPVVTEAQSPSSATSIGSMPTGAGPTTQPQKLKPRSGAVKKEKLHDLQQHLTSLLISDLASSLFSEGSETDKAFWTCLGGELAERHLRTMLPAKPQNIVGAQMDGTRQIHTPTHPFNFEMAFRKMLASFTASSNPSTKLGFLYDIHKLIPLWLKASPTDSDSSPDAIRQESWLADRRASLPSDVSVEGFRRLFGDSSVRPACIFRDLQYIASMVPSNLLETTPQGKAFWNAVVAIFGLKQRVRNIMVETADSIIAYHSNNRGHGRSSSSAQQERDLATFSAPSRTPSAEDISHYKMADAAYLLQITAKEGDPVAQRELATLYLTHPELMDHIIAPFASPKDVFKEDLERKWRKNQDPNRCDPTTMCVAHHWMSLSSAGGDALAKEYLRQREEMERLP